MRTASSSEPPRQKRSAVRDLLTVMSGAAGAQLLGLLILPVLARTFAPEAFGVFQLYLSLLIFSTVAVALRIELTLLSKPDGQAGYTLASLFNLVVVTSLIVTVALWFYGIVGHDMGFPAVFLGLGLVGNGIAQVTSYKLVRDQNFSRLALVKVVQVSVYAVVALMIAAVRPTVWGLIIADVAGRLAAGAISLRIIGNQLPPLRSARFRQLGQFVREHWELAIFSLPGALANSGGAMLTPLMIFHTFGAAAAGQYALVDRAMGVPVAMLVNGGNQVFAGRIAGYISADDRATVLRILLRTVVAGAALSALGAAVAYAIIPSAFRVVFGEGWEQSIIIARILIFAYAVTLISGIVNQTLVSLSAYRLQSAWDMCWPITIGAAWVAVVTQHWTLYTAVTLYAVAIGCLGLTFILLCVTNLYQKTKLQREKEA